MARKTKLWSEDEKKFIKKHLSVNSTGVITWKHQHNSFKIGDELHSVVIYPDSDAYKPKPYARCTIYRNGKRHNYYKHHLVFFLTHGRQCLLYCDHIDQNPLNNAPSNIREVTAQVNNLNRGKQYGKNKIPTSQFKGVSVLNGKYIKCAIGLTAPKKVVHLGYFKTEEQAAITWDCAAYAVHGDNACLNFPDRKPSPEQIQKMKSFINQKLQGTIH